MSSSAENSSLNNFENQSLGKFLLVPNDESNTLVLDSYFGESKDAVIIVNEQLNIVYKNGSANQINLDFTKKSIVDILKYSIEAAELVQIYEAILTKSKIELTEGIKNRKIGKISIAPVLNQGFIFRLTVNEYLNNLASKIFAEYPALPLAYMSFQIENNNLVPLHLSENFPILFPMTSGELLLNNPKFFFKHMFPEDIAKLKGELSVMTEKFKIFRTEFRMLNEDKSVRWYRITAGDLSNSEDGMLIAYFEDIDEIKKQEIENQKITFETLDSERKRISSELHDSIGQNLTAINLTLSQIVSNNESSNHLLNLCKQTISESIVQVKSVCYYLTPPSLDKGLLVGIDTFFGRQNEMSFNINFSFSAKKIDESKLNSEQKYNIYRIIQEFVGNSQKHSKCDQINCNICEISGNIEIEISDNGKGFDISKAKKGFGLDNMQNRARSFCKHVEFESKIGNGTRLKIVI